MIRAIHPRNLALLKHSKLIGSNPASHTSLRRSPGRAGICKSAEDVAIVTVISVVPAIPGAPGLTVQVALAGAPAHVIVATPGSPAAPRSSSA